MDLYELARMGDTEGLEIALLESLEPADLHELARGAIIGGHLDTLAFLIQNGTDDIPALLRLAERLRKHDIVLYLETIHPRPSNLELAIMDDNIELVREMMNRKEATPNQVGVLASRYNNWLVLRSVLKRGADNFSIMADTARINGNMSMYHYLLNLEEEEPFVRHYYETHRMM